MPRNIIETVIEEMNLEFEYYFEDYPEIDGSDIWWYYDPQDNIVKHVANLCKKGGDLSVYYYRRGYCPLYAKLLKMLFHEGKIFHSSSHMIFLYKNEYYDAGGKIEIDPNDYEETPEDFNMQAFAKFKLDTYANTDLLNKMYQKGLQVLLNPKERKKEI